LSAALTRWHEPDMDADRRQLERVDGDEADVERLRALGYAE
jgi:hypothetical protein